MKFLANMGISNRTTAWLRQKGHDAIHLRDQGLRELPDEEILSKARSENRIVLTMDLDFGYLLALSGDRTPRVILFRLSDERSENVNEKLDQALTQFGNDLELGPIVSVGDDAIRARRLPI